MKREILTDDELNVVTGGARSVQFSSSMSAQKFPAPDWLVDIKSDLNPAEFVPMNHGSFSQKLKGIFQRMQLD